MITPETKSHMVIIKVKDTLLRGIKTRKVTKNQGVRHEEPLQQISRNDRLEYWVEAIAESEKDKEHRRGTLKLGIFRAVCKNSTFLYCGEPLVVLTLQNKIICSVVKGLLLNTDAEFSDSSSLSKLIVAS